jgi:hypothetical protein
MQHPTLRRRLRPPRGPFPLPDGYQAQPRPWGATAYVADVGGEVVLLAISDTARARQKVWELFVWGGLVL